MTCPIIHDSKSSGSGPVAHFSAVIEASPSALVLVSSDGLIAMVNRQAEIIFGYERKLLLGQPVEILLPERHRSGHTKLRAGFLADASVRPMGEGRSLFGLRQDGSDFPVEIGLNPVVINGHTLLLAAVVDITERQRAEKQIQFLAYHDTLTGLANRTLLADRLSQALAHIKHAHRSLAVLTVDLDRFKLINDAYGHAAGDQVLVEVAGRLRGVVRSSDTVARLGGDEFVIVLCDLDRPVVAAEVAKRAVAALSAPIEIGGRVVTVGASIGIALGSSDGVTADQMLKCADIALYRAKSEGGSTFRFFTRDMDADTSERNQLAQELREAIGTDQLKLHFQPQFTSDACTITGFEALLRWQHPVRGNIPPAIIIPLAEMSRSIQPLGAWVIEASCAAAVQWPKPHRVAVNLSAAQFRGCDLASVVAGVLCRTGLQACRLELEVTESLLIEDTDLALAVLRSLKELGVSIALDDFGTGYSSLSYLRMFRFDKIKIDKSFIRGLEEDPGAQSIVKAILAMGRSLEMEVIAEGIETDEQLAIMRKLQCREVQGYLLGRPMPLEAVGPYLAGGWSGATRQPAARKVNRRPVPDRSQIRLQSSEITTAGGQSPRPKALSKRPGATRRVR